MTSSAASAAASLPPHPLRFRDYRAYILARLFMTLAQFSMMIIISWQTYSTARLTMNPHAAAAQLGFIGLAQFIPVFLLSPIAGWIADHFDRRKVAVFALLFQFTSASILCYATVRGIISLPLLFGVASLLGVARCFSGPAFSSMVPRLVPLTSMPRAVAFGSMIWQFGTVSGPAMGGYIFVIAAWAPYAISAALFFSAMLAVLSISPQPPSVSANVSRKPLRQILDGIAYVHGNRLVLGVITLDLMAVLLAGSTALLPVYARDIFHVGAQGMGQLAAAPGVGAALSALLFGFRPPHSNVGNKMLISVAIFGVATVGFGLTAFMPTGIAYKFAFVVLFICGVTDMYSVFVRQTLIQVYTPDEMRGRVASFSLLAISASNELGDAESGFFAALVGPATAIIAGGLGAIVTVIIWARLFPEIGRARRFEPVADQEHRLTGEK